MIVPRIKRSLGCCIEGLYWIFGYIVFGIMDALHGFGIGFSCISKVTLYSSSSDMFSHSVSLCHAQKEYFVNGYFSRKDAQHMYQQIIPNGKAGGAAKEGTILFLKILLLCLYQPS